MQFIQDYDNIQYNGHPVHILLLYVQEVVTHFINTYNIKWVTTSLTYSKTVHTGLFILQNTMVL